MYDSGVSAAEFVAQIRNEADISFPVPDASFYRWLTAIEQLIYSELINEQKTCVLDCIANGYEYGRFPLSDIGVSDDEAAVEYRDIVKVYAEYGDTIVELTKGGAVSNYVFYDKNIYCGSGSDVWYSTVEADMPDCIAVIYRVRPAIKTDGTYNVMFPVEFLELVASKLRGEAYKLSNEDGLSAKWIASYNMELDNFKTWVSQRNEKYGE